MKRAAIYARIANKKDNGEELKRQIRKLEAYCEEKDYQVILVIAEYREGRIISMNLLTLLTDSPNIDVIVMRDKNQICVNEAEVQRFETLTNEHGIDIEFLAE